jgi:hypothetical protein
VCSVLFSSDVKGQLQKIEYKGIEEEGKKKKAKRKKAHRIERKK